ncbi:hypothetical protein BH10PLA2_BH10PLA2_16510 [soil metagenome]
MKHCNRCDIRFLTGQGNRGRTSIGCIFGCRKERQREKSNKRGRRHYQTLKGRRNKGTRNRARSLISAKAPQDIRNEATPPGSGYRFPRELIHYIAFLLRVACGRSPAIVEIDQLLQEALAAVVKFCSILRQRSLPGRGG